MLNWNDVLPIIKTVAGKRDRELDALRRQFDDRKIRHVVVTAEPAEPPRDNLRRLLKTGMEAGRPWMIHVEDDAYLAADFSDKALAYINRGIANVWTFYHARKEDEESLAAGKTERRLTPSGYSNSQAVAFPTCLAGPMLAYLPEWEAANPQHRSACDYFIGSFVRRERLLLFASVPSIVQHREVPSLLGHRKRYGRISRTFRTVYGEVPPC